MADELATGTLWDNTTSEVVPGTDMTPRPTGEPAATGTLWGQTIPDKTYVPPGAGPTWIDTARTYAGLTPRALLEANPIDLGANLWGVTADTYNRATGREAPSAANQYLGSGLSGGPTPPGRMIANALGLPTPEGRAQTAYSTGVGMVGGALMSGGISGAAEGLLGGSARQAIKDELAKTLGQIPGLAATGATTGAIGYGLPPWAQVGIGLGTGRLAGEFVPGMMAGNNYDALRLRNAALREGIDIPVGAVGPAGARAVYGATGVLGSGMGGADDTVFRQWGNRGARDIGATTMDNGRLTPSVISDAQTKINGLYSDVRSGAPPVPAGTGSAFDSDVMSLHSNMTAKALTPQPQVENLIYNLLDVAHRNGGQIPGPEAVKMLQGGSPLDDLVYGPDRETSGWARQLKGILQNATTSVMPNDVLSKWNQADGYYKNLQAYKDARTDSSGTITPQSLDAAALKHEPYLGIGGGSVGENAQIGLQFGLKPPVTTTPVKTGLWSAAHNIGGAGAGALTMEALEALRGGSMVDPRAALYGAALGVPTLAGVNRGLRAFSGAPNPPGGLLFYSKLLANPGLWSQANQPGGQAQ